LISDNKEHY
jgi:hypothetical protein